jgi:hypothetical protein
VAEITPEQVRNLLTATTGWEQATQAATTARHILDHTLLDVAREAKLSLRDLVAVTGLHASTIRAGIRRAVGPGKPDGLIQDELPLYEQVAQERGRTL